MKTSKRWIVTALACLLVLLSLAAFKYFQIQGLIAYGKSFPEHSESVEAVSAQISRFDREVKTIGEIIAAQSVELRNEIEGVITAINFQSGDRVKKGDLLVQLDISEESARLKASQARVKLAKQDVERIRRLIRQKSVSQETFDQAEANYAIAQADVLALQASIAKKSLRAPFDAYTGLHQFDVGEYLQSNTAIVTLVGINDFVWVDFNVSLAQANVALGSEVSIELPGKAASVVRAVVIAKDSMASASSRNLLLRARIEGAVEVPPNTVVSVRVPAGHSEKITVPRTSISVDRQGSYVYVLLDDESSDGYRASLRRVVLGFKDDHVAVVEQGLQVGDLVASKGAFKLAPGMLAYVRVRPTLNGVEQVELERAPGSLQ